MKAIIFSLIVLLMLVACASAPQATPVPASTVAPAQSTASSSTVAPTVTTVGAAKSNATLQVGPSGTFLVDAQGITLYMFLKDAPNAIACTGSCLENWPPLVAQGTPTAGTGVNGSKIGTTARPEGGTQVTYSGHPIYHFAGDKNPGDTNGEGIGNNWYVVTPQGDPLKSLTGVGATAPTATANPTASSTSSAPPALSAGSNFVQIGNALNRDSAAADTDPALTVGSLDSNKPGVGWAVWSEKQGNTQQIFVSRQNGNAFEPVAASLNIHANVVAEGPSITFAGQDRTVPWVAWYEPSPGFGNKKNVFASRFNASSGLWVPAGQDRGNNEPSLNIHTNQLAQDPDIIGGTADPTKPPVPWVCWQEVSAHNNAVEIFVSRAVSDTTALGGFHWQPVGLNRSGTAQDHEPSVNLDVTGGSNSDHCQIVFAETNNTVPWVVWAEKIRLNPTQIFVARAVSDNTTGAGGFKWQFVPNCAPADAAKCALNVNPIKEAFEPAMAAGSVVAGQATVPWIAWSEVGATGKKQIFVDRLDPVSRNAFLNVGGSLNVDQNSDAKAPSIAFVGNVPYVAWDEQVGGVPRIFVRHLASDPQTGTWALDTSKEGLAIDKTKGATNVVLRATPEGKVDLIWIQGDPDKEASKIVVCTNATLTSFLGRPPGLAAPLLLATRC